MSTIHAIEFDVPSPSDVHACLFKSEATTDWFSQEIDHEKIQDIGVELYFVEKVTQVGREVVIIPRANDCHSLLPL
jgi:hypothetical protein